MDHHEAEACVGDPSLSSSSDVDAAAQQQEVDEQDEKAIAEALGINTNRRGWKQRLMQMQVVAMGSLGGRAAHRRSAAVEASKAITEGRQKRSTSSSSTATSATSGSYKKPRGIGMNATTMMLFSEVRVLMVDHDTASSAAATDNSSSSSNSNAKRILEMDVTIHNESALDAVLTIPESAAGDTNNNNNNNRTLPGMPASAAIISVDKTRLSLTVRADSEDDIDTTRRVLFDRLNAVIQQSRKTPPPPPSTPSKRKRARKDIDTDNEKVEDEEAAEEEEEAESSEDEDKEEEERPPVRRRGRPPKSSAAATAGTSNTNGRKKMKKIAATVALTTTTTTALPSTKEDDINYMSDLSSSSSTTSSSRDPNSLYKDATCPQCSEPGLPGFWQFCSKCKNEEGKPVNKKKPCPVCNKLISCKNFAPHLRKQHNDFHEKQWKKLHDQFAKAKKSKSDEEEEEEDASSMAEEPTTTKKRGGAKRAKTTVKEESDSANENNSTASSSPRQQQQQQPTPIEEGKHDVKSPSLAPAEDIASADIKRTAGPLKKRGKSTADKHTVETDNNDGSRWFNSGQSFVDRDLDSKKTLVLFSRSEFISTAASLLKRQCLASDNDHHDRS